jgi:hypothetical protein
METKFTWVYDRDADFWSLLDEETEVGGVGNSNGKFLAYLVNDEMPIETSWNLGEAKAAVENAVGV